MGPCYPCYKKIIKLQIKQAWFIIGKWVNFERALKRLPVCDEQDDFFREAQYVILGSDTIWNFGDNYFYDHAEKYLGINFQGKKVISYAVSVGNTSKEVFEDVIGRLQNEVMICSYLVRDCLTQHFVQELLQKPAKIVSDPTLIVTSEAYDELIERRSGVSGEPYLLLYFFNEMSSELWNEVKQIAKKNGWKIVSLLRLRDECDKSVCASPENMIFYFKNASAVLTNTFHGCAFSIIYKKSFAVWNEGKNKVTELLTRYNEQERLVSNIEKLSEALMEPFAEKTVQVTKELQIESLTLLQNALKGEQKGGRCEE